jgi:hypothetical protein
MFRINNILALAALLIGAAILGAPSKAHALFEVVLTDGSAGGGTVTINDNNSPAGTGVDSNPLVGTISWTGTVGHFMVTVQTSVSNASQGILPATLSETLTAFNTDGGVTHTLSAVTSDTGFTVPPAGSPVAMRTTLADTSPVQDPTDTFFSTIGGTNGSTLTSTTSPSSASVTNAETTPSSPYTLANTLTVTNLGAALVLGQGNVNSEIQVLGTTTVSAVPAPMPVVLLLTALPVFGLGGLLSRRRKTVPTVG